MPIHDWSHIPSGLFHDFRQSWSIRIKNALNAGRLPKGMSALVEQRSGKMEADVLAIEDRGRSTRTDLASQGGVITMELLRRHSLVARPNSSMQPGPIGSLSNINLGRRWRWSKSCRLATKMAAPRFAISSTRSSTFSELAFTFWSSTFCHPLRATHLGFTRSSGTRSKSVISRCRRAKTASWRRMKPATCGPGMSRRLGSAMPCPTCRYSSPTAGMFQCRWNRPIKRPGLQRPR